MKHPLIREALRLLDPGSTAWEICSAADIPSGTGLGSSGSFTTALLKASTSPHESVVPDRLAELACHLEIDVLHEPVGKQDQYIAAHGGLTAFTFHPGGRVDVRPLKIDPHTLYDLEDNLLLFFTGYTRSAGAILREQDVKSRDNNRAMVENLDIVKRIGVETVEASRPAIFRGSLI